MRYFLEAMVNWVLWALFAVRINLHHLKKGDSVICYVHTSAVNHAFLHLITNLANDMRDQGLEFRIALLGHNVDVEHCVERMAEFKAGAEGDAPEADVPAATPSRPINIRHFQDLN